MVSIFAHMALAGVALTMPFWNPPEPQIRVMDGFSVPLPPGGRGTPDPAPAEAPPPVTAPPEPEAEPAPPEPAPKVIKPPVEEPSAPRLPEPDAKPARKKPEPAPAARATAQPSPRDPRTLSRPSSTAAGTGTRSTTPGLELAPPGPGVPTGTDPNGDWYLASVQRKIWMLWTQQIKVGFTQPIAVTFTILADGQVTDVRVTPSGVSQLDFAAQRAVMSATPFSPLPKNYGTNRYTIQAIFKPTS